MTRVQSAAPKTFTDLGKEMETLVFRKIDVLAFAQMMAVSRGHAAMLRDNPFPQHQQILQKMVDKADSPKAVADVFATRSAQAYLKNVSHLPVPRGAIFCTYVPQWVRKAHPTLSCVGSTYLANAVRPSFLSEPANVHEEMERWRGLAFNDHQHEAATKLTEPSIDKLYTIASHNSFDDYLSSVLHRENHSQVFSDVRDFLTLLPSTSAELPYSLRQFVGVVDVLITQHCRRDSGQVWGVPQDLTGTFLAALWDCRRSQDNETAQVASLMQSLFYEPDDAAPPLPPSPSPPAHCGRPVIAIQPLNNCLMSWPQWHSQVYSATKCKAVRKGLSARTRQEVAPMAPLARTYALKPLSEP